MVAGEQERERELPRRLADKGEALPNVIGNLEDLSVNENSAAFFQKEPLTDSNAGASF